MTQIIVGSTNRAKIHAVRNAIKSFPAIKDCPVKGITVDVGNRPSIDLYEARVISQRRARDAFDKVTLSLYGVGIERSMVLSPNREKYSVGEHCSVYNGENWFYAPTSTFEIDRQLGDAILESGGDVYTYVKDHHLGASRLTQRECLSKIVTGVDREVLLVGAVEVAFRKALASK